MTRVAALLAALASLLALAAAVASERMLGLVPCALCLVERWPWRIAAVLALLALLVPRRPARLLLCFTIAALLAGVAAAGVHVGVEQHAWPSPLPECAAPHLATSSVAAMLSSMPTHPSKPCDDPTYLIPALPVSMAAMNLIYSLAVAVALAMYLGATRESAR